MLPRCRHRTKHGARHAEQGVLDRQLAGPRKQDHDDRHGDRGRDGAERHVAREHHRHQEDGEERTGPPAARVPRRTPKPVPTPLPPLNWMYSGQLCPAMTASPQSTTTSGEPVTCWARTTATNPLMQSASRHHDHRSPAEGPQNVCAAGLAAAIVANVDSVQPAHQIAGRERAQAGSCRGSEPGRCAKIGIGNGSPPRGPTMPPRRGSRPFCHQLERSSNANNYSTGPRKTEGPLAVAAQPGRRQATGHAVTVLRSTDSSGPALAQGLVEHDGAGHGRVERSDLARAWAGAPGNRTTRGPAARCPCLRSPPPAPAGR